MLKARPIRIGVTVCAIAAMLALSMLPAEHRHTASGGRPIVHRHVIDDVAELARSSLDHGDHRSVTILELRLVSGRQYAVVAPLITVEVALVAPELRFVDRVESIDLPKVHGPPIRAGSPRAPPA